MSEPDATVFVVDDDASIRQALASLIRSAGLKVESFSSAQEFLARPPADVPGCLVLDVLLPGLSGLDLQARMAEIDLEIPVVFNHGARRCPDPRVHRAQVMHKMRVGSLADPGEDGGEPEEMRRDKKG